MPPQSAVRELSCRVTGNVPLAVNGRDRPSGEPGDHRRQLTLRRMRWHAYEHWSAPSQCPSRIRMPSRLLNAGSESEGRSLPSGQNSSLWTVVNSLKTNRAFRRVSEDNTAPAERCKPLSTAIAAVLPAASASTCRSAFGSHYLVDSARPTRRPASRMLSHPMAPPRRRAAITRCPLLTCSVADGADQKALAA